MTQVFNELPSGVQPAPHDYRIIAAGYQVAVREVNLSQVRDKDSLMLAFLSGLGLSQSFGRNWDALYDVLTDPEQFSGRFAVVLHDYRHFKRRNSKLNTELEKVLLDAQANASEQGRRLWVLSETRDDSD